MARPGLLFAALLPFLVLLGGCQHPLSDMTQPTSLQLVVFGGVTGTLSISDSTGTRSLDLAAFSSGVGRTFYLVPGNAGASAQLSGSGTSGSGGTLTLFQGGTLAAQSVFAPGADGTLSATVFTR